MKIQRWMVVWLNPNHVAQKASQSLGFFHAMTVLLLGIGLGGGLFLAPTDYQQGDMFRVMYVHVPSAILSLLIYSIMGLSSLCYLIWKTKIHDKLARSSAPIGFGFTLVTLVSGAIWGKPMWGAYWVWDARLTSELILAILYLGYIGLDKACEQHPARLRLLAYFAVFGLIDVPIVHYSVQWWYTLHQGQSLSATVVKIHPAMLWPLLFCLGGFFMFYCANLCLRLRRVGEEG